MILNSGLEILAYQGTLDYLYARLPMFSRIGAAAIKPNLDNTWALCTALGNPQERFKSVHIAGTNGKGSTSHMLAAVLQKAGYKTGLYTSPHLVDFRERIRIDGQQVSKDFITTFVAAHKELIEEISPSFFEITVAMAFVAFAEEEVDVAVIETGLGGRLDSTNVITPQLSIITNISLDHTDLLGHTIGEIAREKAGIIKPGVPVVIGERHDESMPIFEAVAAQQQARLYKAFNSWSLRPVEVAEAGARAYIADATESSKEYSITTDLTGSYQQQNIATVLTSVEVLTSLGWTLKMEDAITALAYVKNTTGLKGRWDIWQQRPLVVVDVAHNAAGLQSVLKDWQAVVALRKHIILGFVRDKDVRAALALFPKDVEYHFCAANMPRALPAQELAEMAGSLGLKGTIHPSVEGAVTSALTSLGVDDALLITGSFFIVGEAMQVYGSQA